MKLKDVAFGAILLSSMLSPADCLAQSRARVVVITADRNSSTVHRLEEELRVLEVEVVVVTANGDGLSIRKELRRVAQEQGAFAAVRIVPAGDEAEVWVADRVTGKTLVREVVSGRDSGAFDDAISLGAVELLRASLLEVSTVNELKGDAPPPEVEALMPAPKPVPAPKPIRADAPRERSPRAYLVFGIAPAADIGFRRLSVGASIEFDLKALSSSGLGAEFVFRAPFSGQELRAKAGSAEIRSQQFGVFGTYAPMRGDINPSAALGFVAATITSDGRADYPLRTQEQRRFRLLPTARLGLAWKLLPSLALRSDVTLGYALTPLEIRIAGREASSYGRPILAFAAGLEVRLPLEAE